MIVYQHDIVNEIIINVLQLSHTEINSMSPSCLLHKDLGADSLDMVEIVMEIEYKLNIKIPDAEFDDAVCTPDISLSVLYGIVDKYI